MVGPESYQCDGSLCNSIVEFLTGPALAQIVIHTKVIEDPGDDEIHRIHQGPRVRVESGAGR